MIAAKHDKGKDVITTEDFDEFGDKQRTNRYITMEDAQLFTRKSVRLFPPAGNILLG